MKKFPCPKLDLLLQKVMVNKKSENIRIFMHVPSNKRISSKTSRIRTRKGNEIQVPSTFSQT